MLNPSDAFVASKLSAIDKSNTPKLLNVANSITFIKKPAVTTVIKLDVLATGMMMMTEK